MRKLLVFIFWCVLNFVSVSAEYDESGEVYVPKYIKKKFNAFSNSNYNYESPQSGVKTFTKTKTSSYTKTGHHSSYGSSGNSPFSSYSVKTKTGPVFEGGCTTQPPTPMNSALRCSQFSGCLIDCMENYKFPNGAERLSITCQNGRWVTEGVDWDIIPACELFFTAICLPECQNNGICVAPNQCNCPENFSGPQCQYEHKPCLNYPPMPLNAKRVCRQTSCTISCMKGHQFPDGSAIANMVCKDGNWLPSKEQWASIPDCEATCSPPCENGGNCLSFNVCQCPQDFRGPHCQYRADTCNARKLLFNGGYNCTGNADSFSCSIYCPEGIPFEFPPAPMYTCTYDFGVFQPSPIPQCVFGQNMEVIPSGSYHVFHQVPDSSYSVSNLNSHPVRLENPDDFRNDTNAHFVPLSQIGVQQNQYIVVQEKVPEPGVCFTWSGSHLKTFDGKVYSFVSDCAHTLVKDAVDNTFSVVVQNSKDCKISPLNCYKIIKLYFQDKEYVLKLTDLGIPIFLAGKKFIPIPGRLPGIRVEMAAHFVLVSLDSVGAKIKWDGQQMVQVEVKENLWNRTQGLCGRFDGILDDDMQAKDGSMPESLVTFVSSWQVDSLGDSCNSVVTEEQVCPESDIAKAHKASKFCKKLLADPRFTVCHDIMDVAILEDACRADFCNCHLPDPTECACETMSIYVKECQHKGIKSLANWRDENTCPMKCSGGKVYLPCGPSKGQAVCGAATENFEEEESCVEGCYCPEGTVLHESKCITRDKCPCRLRGKSFPAGSSVPKECNTCTCSDGQWVCTQVSCGARCSAIGDPHYITFDGKRYDFMGQCSYYLVKTDNFSIEAENVACAGAISQAMNFPISVSSGLPSCTKAVTIKMSGQTIKLKQNHDVVVNGQDITKIPYVISGISVRAVSSIFLQVELPNGVEIWWDGVTRVYVDVPASFQGKTKGLCGTFNNNQKDDFLTPENDIEQSVIPFANKWKTTERCNDIPDKLLENPCEVNVQNKATAEMYCSKIKADLFKACHFYVDPEPFYRDCLFDMCSCETKVSKCLCSVMSAYAQECSLQGIKIDWRNNVRECGVHCPGGQKYQVCGNSCTRTCKDVATRPDCRPHCVEGCNCPEGHALDDQGECIPLGQCTCWHEGLEFPAGYKEIRPASKSPELCTCTNAVWSCKPATPMEMSDFPNANDLKTMCNAADNLEFTTCENVEPTTCKNMHSQEMVSASVCHPGCQCKAGYVLDTVQKKCVLPSECPCHHGGRSYGENATVQSDCNTCVCKNGKWQCTDRQCAAECSTWGDSHFKTFDGKIYDYQGQCDYVFAKGFLTLADSFDVVIQSVPCGSLGVTCSKSVVIKVGFGPQQEVFSLTKDKEIPAHKLLKRLTVREKGLYVIVEAADLGFVVHWDKGTRVYVKVDPRWKNRIKGLCGNYNDNEQDDFQTPSGGLTEASANIFGDSWRLQPYCPEALEITNTCEERPDRKVWSLKKCGILKSPLFAPCHSEVPVDAYYERCIFDTCACDQGGDCECLCTALAAYAQECNNRGAPIKWRSQELCPMQCDERCAQYSPCISTCPTETCDNMLIKGKLSKICTEDTCVEGCQTKPCPPGQVYLNSSLLECVPRNTCKVFCMEVEGVTYYEGDLLEEDSCHTCYCSRGQRICKGQPCSTPGGVTDLPPVTHQNEASSKCVSGWTEWINQDKTFVSSKYDQKSTDKEPLPDSLILNLMKSSSKCGKDKMVNIECRTVKDHIPSKETGLNVVCSLEEGLLCESVKGGACPDFEIRVFCQCDTPSTQTTSIPTTVPLYAPCDITKPNQDHPSDCHLFYQCVPGLNGPELQEKSCGPDMMYNPETQVCDWPNSVMQIKPQCGEKPRTHYQTVPTPIEPTGLCKEGFVYDACAMECHNMCHYYSYVVKRRGFCEEDIICQDGCRDAKRNSTCPIGLLWNNNLTCVLAQHCMCASHAGVPVKPGTVFHESDCEVCQCIDNFYTCDASSCNKTAFTSPPSITNATPTQPSKPVPLSNLVLTTTVTPPKECDKRNFVDLIQGDMPLKDEAFSASSTMSPYFAPKNARFLDTAPADSAGSWVPEVSDKDQYLQINLGQLEPVYGVKIKGSPLYNEFVTSYKVLYSSDGVLYSYVTDKEKNPKTFRGSISRNIGVEQLFDEPIEAQIIRINPQTWIGGISLRVELIGCREPDLTAKPTVPTTIIPEKPKFCEDPLGVDSGMLSDQQIVVSSELPPDHDKTHLKLTGNEPWQPLTNSPMEWVQFDFLELRNLTGVTTKGGPDGWVTAFGIKYSQDEKIWNPVLESATEKVFPGNFDSDTPHTVTFDLPISARYLKIIPLKWHNTIQLRVEPLGCYLPYPTFVTTTTTTEVIPTACNYCPGVTPLEIELGGCKCEQNLWWNGENCVSRNQCPCVVGHITYEIGSIFEKEDCSQCICKLGGQSYCTPKECDKCEEGLQSIVTSTCKCICKPCDDGKTLCPTSNVCINSTSWCNGVQDCPDDEVNCATTKPEVFVTVPPQQATKKPDKCPKITCPPNYRLKRVEPNFSYHSSMFKTVNRNLKSPYRGIKTGGVKTAYRKTLQKPNMNTTKTVYFPQQCPEYKCIRPAPKFPNNTQACPAMICPAGFLLELDSDVKSTKCPQFSCVPPPPPEAVCNVTGRTFNTFDRTEYKYDICSHILVRDLENDEWDVELKKNCTTSACYRDLVIRHQEHLFTFHPDLTVEYDGYKYTIEQTKKIGLQAQSFALSLLGNTLLFSSNRYGFWVIWDKNGNVKVGVVRKLLGKVDGLCGYFNDVKDDDKRKPDGSEARTTVDFGDSWATAEKHPICEIKTCPIHVQNKAWEMCNKIRDQSFAACAGVIDIEAFISRCMETTCNCLEAANENNTAQDKCRCETLQMFVVDCLSADSNIDLSDWRMQNDCPTTCESPLVYHDCYQRRCEPTCETISDPNICPKINNLCFPGCYCPPGLVRKGQECVKPSTCRDCECNLLPHLQYVTYDESNFTVNGNCVYVMSRNEAAKDSGKHNFQVLVTNHPCRDQDGKMCVGKITILYEGHKIHIFYDNSRNKLKIIVDGEVINNFSDISQWATVTETLSKHIRFLMNKAQVEVSVYFPSLGVSIKAPSHKYGGHLEGLCGNCNRNPNDDWRTPKGEVIGDEEELGLSWLYEKLPGGQTRESCSNKPVETCEALPMDDNPCVQLVDVFRFGQCHPLLDPTLFIEWCNKDTCGGHPERACTSIQAYATECMHLGFCVDWHSDLCPAETCPVGQVYESCSRNCFKTCEDVLSKEKKCGYAPVEGCFCPEGKVLLNGTCVEKAHCEVCDNEGHHPGDTWQKDPCTSCACVGTTQKCETKHCPTLDKVCEVGFTAIKVKPEKDECCDKFICVPEATESPVCEPPQKIPCGPGQIMKIITKPDGCQQFVCQCKPPEDCEKVNMTGPPLEDGYARVMNDSGCCPFAEVVCKPETCPKPEVCEKFYTLKEEAEPGKCCSKYFCEAPKDKCIFEGEYAADEKGGEKLKTKYEKQKVLKDLTETWHDGPCRTCKCVESPPGTYHPQCTKTECPQLETYEDFKEYVLKPKPLHNQCCPEIKRTACKHEGNVYNVGDEWPETPDYCVMSRCIETYSGIEKRTTTMNCNKDCEIGWEYVQPEKESKKCCGVCKPVACVVDGMVKKVGEQWEALDHCTSYVCLNVNGSFSVQANVVNCPKLTEDSLKNYVYNITPIEGECCPKMEATACKVGNKEYMVGEKWPSPDGDKCKTFTCTRNDKGEVAKSEQVETCKTHCKKGYEYRESKDLCCGECVPVACVVDDVLKKPGENWTSSDKCTTYSCEQFGDQFSVSSQQESCPDLADCPTENVYTKGCCKYCNITTDAQKDCVPEEMPANKSIGIVKQMRPPHGLCKNEDVLQGFTECIGSCHSSTYFNPKLGSHESVCACCRATKYETLYVELVCEDGYKFKKKVAVPARCGCEDGCEKAYPKKTSVKGGY